MDPRSTIFIAIGAIVAALITGVFSFVSLVTTKEQKTSEFRQEWIDSLREDISQFLALAYTLAKTVESASLGLVNKPGRPSRVRGFLEQNRSDWIALVNLYRRIVLRLNPDEHATLIATVRELYDLFDEPYVDVRRIMDLQDAITRESQSILKAEWERVKAGEPVFRTTKVIALITIVAVVLLGVAAWLGKVPLPKLSPVPALSEKQ